MLLSLKSCSSSFCRVYSTRIAEHTDSKCSPVEAAPPAAGWNMQRQIEKVLDHPRQSLPVIHS